MKRLQSERVPTDDGAIAWRPLSDANVEDLVGLLERIEEVDNPPYRTTGGEVRDWLSASSPWRGAVGYAKQGPMTGHAVCFGYVVLLRNSDDECLCQGGVDPRYRAQGLGGTVVRWETETGKELLEDSQSRGSGHITVYVDASQNEFEEHLKRQGFSWISSNHELRRDLSDLPDKTEIGPYFAVQPWGSELEDPARRLYNRLLEKQSSGRPHGPQEWLWQRDSFADEWSFAAFDRTGDRPQMVGFILVGSYHQDWEVLGWKEGYIDLLGVTEFRATSDVSRALVLASMEAQIAAGMQKVATGVGTPTNSQALSFYEDLGFARSFQTRTYSFQV